MTRTYIFACGGTGGHIFPALAVGEELRRRDTSCRIVYVCGKKDIESAIFKVAKGEHVSTIEMAPFRGMLSFADPRFLLKLSSGFFASIALIRSERPSLVVGFGGYISFPVIAAAKLCGVPTMIHEQNVWPGKANRVLAGSVDAVAMSFRETAERGWDFAKARVTGNPIRLSVERDCREEAVSFFGFSQTKRTLLVLGGSQGAESVNTLFFAGLEALPAASREKLQVLHLCGRMRPQDSEDACGRSGVTAKAYSFFDRMDLAYGAADLCIGRAGATFLAEVRTKGIPVLLVPYPHGDGHQRANADLYRRLIGARVEEQSELNAKKMAELMRQMIEESSHRPATKADDARAKLADFIELCAKK